MYGCDRTDACMCTLAHRIVRAQRPSDRSLEISSPDGRPLVYKMARSIDPDTHTHTYTDSRILCPSEMCRFIHTVDLIGL
jgi:hypothetical protein